MEEYYQAIRAKLQLAITYNFIVGDKDVTDIIRGKIQIIDEILQTKDIFERYDTLQKSVQDEENRLKGNK